MFALKNLEMPLRHVLFIPQHKMELYVSFGNLYISSALSLAHSSPDIVVFGSIQTDSLRVTVFDPLNRS